ncbi:DUF4157 domain-containing protein [Mucilaginibacter sp. RS28]|uniref:DUF4157 domain-containing protein n=1 Tax=Mucilaginibacter straminoryzae TaxID=2932774 RepID=A0A9X1X029_9SPHI|nr:DUF4157 domain-containing protein [Mucilaginibacter straminoryzae]MCJ8208316.1 DUF4157 domain-containing protein [Mucilaginibacter straminoryzae]
MRSLSSQEKNNDTLSTTSTVHRSGLSRQAVPVYQSKSDVLNSNAVAAMPAQFKVAQLVGGSHAEEEEPLQMQSAVAQRVGGHTEEEEPLQMKAAPIQKKENNTGMPDSLKAGVENLSGIDMSDVKVHYNSSQPKQLQAHAFAQGTDIHIASGQEQHLPHEAWHVVQQKQGRVQPTMQMKAGVAINDDKGLESEADAMGARAAAHGSSLTN